MGENYVKVMDVSDAGDHKCLAVNDGGDAASTTQTITVNGKLFLFRSIQYKIHSSKKNNYVSQKLQAEFLVIFTNETYDTLITQDTLLMTDTLI
jgi:hypothetical protein